MVIKFRVLGLVLVSAFFLAQCGGLQVNDLDINAETFTDTDGDLVVDASDNCPNLVNADQADSDNDGIGDICDSVDNNITIPSPVSNVIISDTGNCEVTVTWNDNSNDEDEFYLTRYVDMPSISLTDATTNATVVTLDKAGTGTQSFVDTNFTVSPAMINVSYIVRSRNAAGDSAWSAESNVLSSPSCN